MTAASAAPAFPRTRAAASAAPPSRVQVFLRLMRYLARRRGRLTTVLIALFIGNVALALIPVCLGLAVNVIAEQGAVQDLLNAVYALCFFTLIMGGALWLGNRTMADLAQDTMLDLRREFFDHLQGLSLSFFDRQPIGELMSSVTNDLEAINQFFSNGFSQAVNALLTFAVLIALMLLISLQMTIASLIFLPLVLLTIYFISRVSGPAFARLQQTLGEANGFMEETLLGHKTLTAYNQQAWAAGSLERMSEDVRLLGTRAQIAALLTQPITRVLSNVQMVITILFGALMASNGRFGFGVVMIFVLFNSLLQVPLSQFSQVLNLVLQAIAGSERVFAILDMHPTVQEKADAQPLPDIEGRVEFQHVDFSYVPGRRILHDNSFTALPGQMIGLCGPTGAGKSTIINILTRYYDVDSGAIRIDGADVCDATLPSLRRQIAHVLQEPFLFSATVMENLRYARAEATDEELIAAATEANAHEFIMALPEGYQTFLDGGGESLSQGQRQMLTIARAMAAQPRMLILDEATSNVDTRTEKLVQQGLQRLMANRTSFVIAHRLSTIRPANMILVIRDGAIIERGTHDELMAMRGFYFDLYQSQFRTKATGA